MSEEKKLKEITRARRGIYQKKESGPNSVSMIKAEKEDAKYISHIEKVVTDALTYEEED